MEFLVSLFIHVVLSSKVRKGFQRRDTVFDRPAGQPILAEGSALTITAFAILFFTSQTPIAYLI